MKHLLPWVSMIWLPLFVTYAQGPTTAEAPRAGWPKSTVTVVFAPERGRPVLASYAYQRGHVEHAGRSTALQANGGQAPRTGNPVEFRAPRGLTGIRLGNEFAMAGMATVGSDGKLHFECGRISEAAERWKQTKSVTRSTGKETPNDH